MIINIFYFIYISLLLLYPILFYYILLHPNEILKSIINIKFLFKVRIFNYLKLISPNNNFNNFFHFFKGCHQPAYIWCYSIPRDLVSEGR